MENTTLEDKKGEGGSSRQTKSSRVTDARPSAPDQDQEQLVDTTAFELMRMQHQQEMQRLIGHFGSFLLNGQLVPYEGSEDPIFKVTQAVQSSND